MPRRKQVWRYSTAKRDEILETACRERLSGAQVAKRFGISMWTYYSWRSPARGIHVKSKRDPRVQVRARAKGNGDLRADVEAQVRRVMPAIVKEEVNALLVELFGRRGPGRPRTRV
jgi:transposase-like protein